MGDFPVDIHVDINVLCQFLPTQNFQFPLQYHIFWTQMTQNRLKCHLYTLTH